jgi:hypothetical protein
LDICCVDTLIPRHSKIIRPVNATATRNLVRVRNIIIAFQGGNLDLADFQVTPPLGRSILSIGEWKVVGREKGVGDRLRRREEKRDGLTRRALRLALPG